MPFSWYTTAEEALRETDVTGKVAVVTGGNAGIGTETVRVLAAAGARVIFTSRKPEAGDQVALGLRESGIKGTVEMRLLDLADLASVRAFAAGLNKEPRIDLLILNAGVMACPQAYTKDGFELQIGTNHFGHFALVQGVIDKMRQQDFPSRIVVVASLAAKFVGDKLNLEDLHWRKRTYSAWMAYSSSKMANILFAQELARRLQGTKVQAFSLHPGSIGDTNLKQHMVASVPQFLTNTLLFFMKPFLKTVAQGAATTIYAATAPELDGQSGAYLDCCKVVPAYGKEEANRKLAAELWQITEEQIAKATAGAKQ